MAFIIPKWSAHNVSDWEALFVINADGRKDLNTATAMLINYMPIIGVTEITLENAVDVLCRINLIECIYGSFVKKTFKNGDERPFFFTKDDVLPHIGLETEGKSKTFAEFYDQFCQEVAAKRIESSKTAAYIANGNCSLLDLAKEHSKRRAD